MPLVTITKRVLVSPKHLHSDVDDYILGKLRKMCETTCDETNGYLVEIVRVVEKTNRLSFATADIIFTVTVEAETLLPKIGDVYTGVVQTINARVVIIEIAGRMGIGISADKFKRLGFTFKQGHYEAENGDIIDKNDEITARITFVNYVAEEGFRCIGELVV